MHVMEHTQFEELRQLRELEELDRLGPEAVAEKKRGTGRAHAAYRAAEADYKQRAAATVETLRRIRPSWAQALIVAEALNQAKLPADTFARTVTSRSRGPGIRGICFRSFTPRRCGSRRRPSRPGARDLLGRCGARSQTASRTWCL